MKNFLVLLLAGLYSMFAGGPETVMSFERAVLTLSGASSLEELSESEIERYETFLSHPLQINLSPRSKLLSSALMSRYQVASLCDYRERTGDVLGVTELSLVDGFGEETAAALGLFVGFESSSPPGSRPNSRVKQSALLRSGIKVSGKQDPASYSYGLKYTLEYGQRATFFWSARDGTMPGTFSLALYGRGGGKLVLGDFNDNPLSYTVHRLSRGRRDTFVQAGKGFGATFRTLWPLLRIDYILYPPGLEAVSYEVPRVKYSDHYPIIATYYEN